MRWGRSKTSGSYNFTDRVRKVLAMTREEAIRLQHHYVGTEHILLGLIRERGCRRRGFDQLFGAPGASSGEGRGSVRPGRATMSARRTAVQHRRKKVLEFAMAEAP